MSEYDSELDTRKHIARVREYLMYAVYDLTKRAADHDKTKLEDPEKELFDRLTPKLKNCTYGSDEYYEFLEELKPALDHHYKQYPHHPQHYEEGIKGMNLFDLLEMFLDWKAASERHDDGNIYASIKKNQDRFGYTDETRQYLINTAKYLGW